MRKLGIHTKVDHPRVRYTLEFLQQHPLLRRAGLRMVINNAYEENEWNIVYQNSSKPDAADYRIPVQAYFFRPESPAVDWSLHTYRFEGKKVYSVEPDTQPEILPMVQDRLFQFDVLETIFFHISRFEEVFAPPEKHNDSGWLDERHHLLLQHQIQQIPVVDQLVASLLHLLLGKAVRFDTTYELTHDIDFLYRYPHFGAVLRALGGSLFRREGLSAMGHHWKRYRQIKSGAARDPYDTFDWLLSPAPNWQKKVLYLMAGGETAHDNHYRPDDPKVREVIELARSRGYLIGLHPSYNAGFKPELFQREKQKLEHICGQTIVHSRQHWLRWKWPHTPYLLEQAQIREDASFGYRRHLGFRAGTGFPYRPYNFHSEKAFRWTERPLALMESAALHEARHSGKDVIRLLDDFLALNRRNTRVGINFHNSNFDPTQPGGLALAAFYRNKVLQLDG